MDKLFFCIQILLMKSKKTTSKTIITRLANNSIIFVISIFLAFILFYISKDTNIFQASILWINDIEKIQENNWDIAYKNTDWLLDIFLSDKLLLKDYSSLSITIVYDYQSVFINTDNISFQKKYKINFNQSWSITISFDDLKNINSKESFFIIPFSWSVKDILISEAIVKKWNIQDSLAVGNLSIYTEH